MGLLRAFSVKMTRIQPDMTNRAYKKKKKMFIQDYNTDKTLSGVRFSSSEAKTEDSIYWGAENKGGGRAASNSEDFPRLQAPLILQSFARRQHFCFTACKKAAVYTSSEKTSYLIRYSNPIYFKFPEHLDKKNQNGHQNTKYYCKLDMKVLCKQMVNKILHSWSEPFCFYWSWRKIPQTTEVGGSMNLLYCIYTTSTNQILFFFKYTILSILYKT